MLTWKRTLPVSSSYSVQPSIHTSPLHASYVYAPTASGHWYASVPLRRQQAKLGPLPELARGASVQANAGCSGSLLASHH